MNCSAPGCDFASQDELRPASAALRLFCEFHATGRRERSTEIHWRPACACGSYADGFETFIAGVLLARHAVGECFERTPRSGVVERPGVGPRKCTCGKQVEGIVSVSDGFSETHALWECTKRTRKPRPSAHRPAAAVSR